MAITLEGASLAKEWGIPNESDFENLSPEIQKEIENAKLKEKSELKLEDWRKSKHYENKSNSDLM